MNKVYHATQAFLDMLFLLLAGFTCLFIISFIMMKQEQSKKKNIEAKAEFIITVTWDKEVNDDVDLHVEDPNGGVVYFQRRTDGMMVLERDDLGHRNDRIRLPDGSWVKYEENREMVTIRGIVQGEWIINVHMYHKESQLATPVNIRLEKINPTSTTVFIKDVTLEKNGDEETAFRFTLDADGQVTDINELEKSVRDFGSGGYSGGSRGDNYYDDSEESYDDESEGP